jgi:hypothetical protein
VGRGAEPEHRGGSQVRAGRHAGENRDEIIEGKLIRRAHKRRELCRDSVHDRGAGLFTGVWKRQQYPAKI